MPTYQVRAGGHDSPDLLAEVRAMVAWGLFKPVMTNSRSWVNLTVATTGQLWDIGYRFSRPPDQVVQFRRTARQLSISAAGSPVTITTSRHCLIHTSTPATILRAAQLPPYVTDVAIVRSERPTADHRLHRRRRSASQAGELP